MVYLYTEKCKTQEKNCCYFILLTLLKLVQNKEYILFINLP